MHFFNTAGPINKNDHFCIDPLKRFNTKEIIQLINQKKYFVLYAPRQTGKTSFLLSLADYLNRTEKYLCLYLNIESIQIVQKSLDDCIKGILFELSSRARDYLDDNYPESIVMKILNEKGPNFAINELLTLWAKNSEKPIVLLIDEFDSLKGEILLSVLSQLRSGYDKRPKLFPHSIILCGVNDIKNKADGINEEYNISIESVFNIKATSVRLDYFNKKEIKMLFYQHMRETGQKYNDDAFDKIWELTRGQPWIVNALGNELCSEMIPAKRNISVITSKEIEEAAENLIQKREIHIKHLIEKLKEERVKKIILPMLIGDDLPEDFTEEDFLYVHDLGLIRKNGKITIANEIYREIIPRSLIYSTQLLIKYKLIWFFKDNGSLNINKMMRSFQIFYRKHSERWIERFTYREAGPQLLLQAFLQRIVDGGGRISRKYELNREYVTLIISWQYGDKLQKIIFDIRNHEETYKKTMKDGIENLAVDMKKYGSKTGHLVIINQEEDTLWEEKIFNNTKTYKGIKINIWGI